MRLLKLTGVAFILWVGPACAEVIPGLSIAELVHSADLIIAGRIENVRQTGSGDITFSGHAYRRRDFEAEIRVDEAIKGEFAGSRFIFSYSTPTTDGSGNVGEGNLVSDTFRMVFLKKTRDGYAFVSPYFPSLPASSTRCGPAWQFKLGEDVYHKVLQRILAILCSTSTTVEKRDALTVLSWEGDSSAASFLKAALSLPEVYSDPELRTAILADLLKWKDLSVLPSAEDDLFQSSEHVGGALKSNLLLAISSLDPRVSVPLLTRALRLPEPDARIDAARFLEYTNSDSALDGLLSALDDPDRDVQFAAMQSLGNLTSQHQWRPQTITTDDAWSACMKHWREFGALRYASKPPQR